MTKTELFDVCQGEIVFDRDSERAIDESRKTRTTRVVRQPRWPRELAMRPKMVAPFRDKKGNELFGWYIEGWPTVGRWGLHGSPFYPTYRPGTFWRVWCPGSRPQTYDAIEIVSATQVQLRCMALENMLQEVTGGPFSGPVELMDAFKDEWNRTNGPRAKWSPVTWAITYEFRKVAGLSDPAPDAEKGGER